MFKRIILSCVICIGSAHGMFSWFTGSSSSDTSSSNTQSYSFDNDKDCTTHTWTVSNDTVTHESHNTFTGNTVSIQDINDSIDRTIQDFKDNNPSVELPSAPETTVTGNLTNVENK